MMMTEEEKQQQAAGVVDYVEVRAGTSFTALHHELNSLGLNLAWQSGGIQGLTVSK